MRLVPRTVYRPLAVVLVIVALVFFGGHVLEVLDDVARVKGVLIVVVLVVGGGLRLVRRAREPRDDSPPSP